MRRKILLLLLLSTCCMFDGTLDGGDGVSLGDSTLCGDPSRIRFRATLDYTKHILNQENEQATN